MRPGHQNRHGLGVIKQINLVEINGRSHSFMTTIVKKTHIWDIFPSTACWACTNETELTDRCIFWYYTAHWLNEFRVWVLYYLKPPGLSKDIRCHVWSYSFLCLQIIRSDIKPHVFSMPANHQIKHKAAFKFDVSLVITHGQSIFRVMS